MSKAYAKDTAVPVERSQAELCALMRQAGATHQQFGSGPGVSWIEWATSTRHVRVTLPIPDITHRDFTHTPKGVRRSPADAARAHAQHIKAGWRQLVLVVKAKLEAIRAGISTFDDEFLAFIVTADGRTVSQAIRPALESAKPDARRLLPGGKP